MITLFCAILSAAEVAFPVNIDAEATVGHLKDAVKAKNSVTIFCDAKDLQLFLGKKNEGRGAYVTQCEAQSSVVDSIGFKKLLFPDVTLQEVGLTRDQLGKVSAEERAAGKGSIHVLIVLPERIPPQAVLWLLTGCVHNALVTKGIRSTLYWMASSRIGFYDPRRRIGNTNVAFWYQGNQLCFHVLFESSKWFLRVSIHCKGF
ncbi:hypothetical protein CCR75_001066 [Bremia lactucae]|uniref:Crinkler effector protein N-terminal domain-containing protein n=1 Tax=Bremia lactucae TaxID=4779 RepID=A0A976IH29_BRELC|nr:hypothetical protein CCR75_001066 [Bremia lactucae]